MLDAALKDDFADFFIAGSCLSQATTKVPRRKQDGNFARAIPINLVNSAVNCLDVSPPAR
jgi:hypothetical protein